MGDIVPHPLWCSEQFLGEGVVCSAASMRGTRVLERCRCLVSSIRLRRFCDTVRGRCWVRRPLPNDSKTLPLRTTGPAAARTSASDARARNASGARTTIWFRSVRRLQEVEYARRGIRNSVLEDSDVGLFERIAVTRKSDLTSEL